MVIGAEPSISRNYQVVYGFGNIANLTLSEIASYHYQRDDIWNYFTRLFTEKGDTPKEFLEKCYITDLCHVVPQRCGTIQSICRKLEITLKDWDSFRTALALKFMHEEIRLIKPKLIVLHGNVSREFFKKFFGIKFHSVGKVKNTKYLIRRGEWEGIPILSIPHLKGQVRNKLWNCSDRERFESAKAIIKDNFCLR